MKRLVAAAALLCASSVSAQDYPTKPVRLVTAEVGGGHDLTARLLAQGLTAQLGQQFIVENRAGAAIAGPYAAKAPPDGYTLLIYGGSLWLMPFMRSHVLTATVKSEMARLGKLIKDLGLQED